MVVPLLIRPKVRGRQLLIPILLIHKIVVISTFLTSPPVDALQLSVLKNNNLLNEHRRETSTESFLQEQKKLPERTTPTKIKDEVLQDQHSWVYHGQNKHNLGGPAIFLQEHEELVTPLKRTTPKMTCKFEDDVSIIS